MGKQSGLGDGLWIGGHDLSGDIGAVSNVGGGLAGTQDVTGINKLAPERVGLERDGRIEFSAFFNPDLAIGAHAQLSALPRTNQVLTYCRGTGLGSPAACLVGKQIDYAPTRGADGSLTIAVSAQANGFGLEWGRLGTPGLRTDAAPTDGASLDGAATLFGLQAYLHVAALTGTSVTVTVQESADDGASDPWADVVGGAFTAATAVGAQRIVTARDLTVKRYLRVVTTGTFTAATIGVVLVRNQVEVTF